MTTPSTQTLARSVGRGFSLIELVITLAIMAVLASLVTPVAQIAVQREREQVLRRALLEIRRGIDDYKRAVDEGRIAKSAGVAPYPGNLEQLVSGVVDQRDPKHARMYFLRRIPSDPMQADPALVGAASWALRSYSSEADAPQSGSDVYDVMSTSARVGLNGRPYNTW